MKGRDARLLRNDRFHHFCTTERQACDSTQVKNGGQKETKQRQERSQTSGPLDTSVHTRTERQTVQLCGDSNVAENRLMDTMPLVRSTQKMERIQKRLHSWWEKEVAYLITQIDDHVKHHFREHNREADHLANLGADGQRKIIEKK